MWLPVTLSGGSLEPAGDGRTRQMIIHDITRLTVLLASNLLVVLCGSHDTQPIVNTGSIY